MKHTVRIVAKGYWGALDPPPFSFASNPGQDEIWKRLKRAEKNVNVWRYADGGSGDTNAPALGLSYAEDFPDAFNSLFGWSQVTTGTNYLVQMGTTGSKGLYHSDNTANAAVAYMSYAPSLIIEKNMPFVVRGQLFKRPATQTVQRFTLRWHKYQLQIVRGDSQGNGADYGIHIMRLTPSWTQTLEDELNGWEDTTPVSDVLQGQIDARRTLIYADYQNVSGSVGEKGEFQLVFIPEPGGKLTIILSGEKTIDRTTVKHSVVINHRTPPGETPPVAMWEAGPLTIRNNGGAFQWQAGQLRFAATGNLKVTGPFDASSWDVGDAEFNLNRSEPDNTTISASIEPVAGTTKHEIVVAFTTADTRYTPFLYGVAALIPGGARTGSSSTVWDSADHLLSTGSTCIADCELNVGSEMEVTWANVTVRDPNGTIFNSAFLGGLGSGELGYDYEALENRIVDVYIDGGLFITNGIVISAAVTTVASAEPGLERTDIARPETGALLTIYDRWALLDEMPCDSFVYPGDGLYLNDYVRTLMLAAGEAVADVGADLTGQYLANNAFGIGTPRKLPQAPPGETWQVMPSENETFGDYIRRIVDRWGMGYKTWLNGNGTYGWAIRPTGTVIAAFHGNPTGAYSDVGFPDRLTILAPLDFQRDYAEFGNFFAVEGAEGPNGVPLYSAKTVINSLNIITPSVGAHYRDRRHIGRLKPWPTVKDSSLRTFSEVVWVRRSLRARYGQPGRFFAFETYCLAGYLYPGDTITANGLKGMIVNMSGMSAARDRGTITCRELWDQS